MLMIVNEEYLEIIAHCLKQGGYWVNLGPLLFHWADSHQYLSNEEMSVRNSCHSVDDNHVVCT